MAALHLRPSGTARSLLDALDARVGTPAERAAFDEQIWRMLGSEAAVLVTDLSGFTRLTKKHGIVHFLSVYQRCYRTCKPILDAHGGTLIKEVADDMIALFASPEAALRAGLHMLRACADVNAQLADEDDRVQLALGLDYGRLLRLDDDAYGDPVNVAHKLGEDTAEPGEILIGRAGYDELRRCGFPFEGCTVSAPRTAIAGKAEIEHVCVALAVR